MWFVIPVRIASSDEHGVYLPMIIHTARCMYESTEASVPIIWCFRVNGNCSRGKCDLHADERELVHRVGILERKVSLTRPLFSSSTLPLESVHQIDPVDPV